MRRTLLFLSALSIAFAAGAQLTANYPPANGLVFQGTYTDLGTDGTAITTANNDDALSAAQPIGFTFTYNGVGYTDFVLSTNGFIKLGTTPPSTASLQYPGPQGTAPPTGGLFNSTNSADVNLISPFTLDLVGTAGVEYRVYTTPGPVGSRVCTIQFENVTEKTSTVVTQISSFEFQIRLYETTNIIEFVYGNAVPSNNVSNFKSAIVGLKGSSNASNQIVSVTKGSTQAWNLATFLAGNYTGNSFNYGGPPARPLPVAGVTYKFIPVYSNDIGVLAIYTLGKIPKQYVSPQYIRARIKNTGTATQSNFKVYLKVRGTNVFDDSVAIASLAPNGEQTVSFAGYTATTNGLDTITVHVNTDDNVFNDSKYNTQLVNDDVYSYADPNIPAGGGVGFTGSTGQFCAKFPYSGVANSINQVGVNFFQGGVLVQIGIWGKNAATGGPGALLWSSPQFTSVTGLNTLPVNPPVSVTDTFFAGVLQPGTVNANFAFQNEVPVRDQTFYYGGLNSTTWFDFASAGSNFRFMIEPRFQSPNDLGVTSIDYPCQMIPLGQSSLFPVATVFNYGLLSQSSVPVECAIYYNNTQVYSATAFLSTLASGASTQVTFPSLFSPSAAGLYTIKTWTALSGDASAGNDTASSTLNIVDYSAVTDAGNRIQLDGVDDYITVLNSPALNPGQSLTIEGWFNPTTLGATRTLVSKDSASTALAYNLSLNSLGFPVFTVNTGTTATATSTIALLPGTWYHVAATYDGTELRVYVNGELTGSAVHSGFIPSNDGALYIGKTGGTTPLYYSGGIEELRIFGAAKTALDIRLNMHTRVSLFGDPNLVAYYRFDEGTGTFYIADGSGNCNHGTLVNMDINNTSASPAWFASSIPLGAPAVANQTVTSSGNVSFAGTSLSIQFTGFSGQDEYFVHMFNGVPEGTLPTTTPGGITATHPRTWLIYRYGAASFTSADANFELINNTLLPTAVNADVMLFNRSNGSAAGWSLTQNGATALTITPPTATFTFTPSSAFNQQFVVGGNNNPLPIHLIRFDARAEARDAVLDWQTSGDEQTDQFVLERSSDGERFHEISTIKARGNGQDLNQYSYVDRNIGLQQAKVYYRLKLTGLDGKYQYADVQVVRFGMGAGTMSVQPNPFREVLGVTYDAAAAAAVKVTVTDLQGKLLLEREFEVNKGRNELQIRDWGLAPGMYLLQLTDQQGTQTQKIVRE